MLRKGRAVWLPGYNAEARQNYIDGFQGKVHANWTDEEKARFNVRFMIGTVDSMGAGVTLTEADRIVLMEPNHRYRAEKQAYDRIDRIGTRHDRLHHFRFVGNTRTELHIVHRNWRRQEIASKAMDQRLDKWVKEQQAREEAESRAEAGGDELDAGCPSSRTIQLSVVSLKHHTELD
jgi:SNF2 family DNA or RNA helicase